MKLMFRIFLVLSLLLVSVIADAEIGETDVIDAVATKPDSNIVILLIAQARPWSETTLDLLNKKLSYYKEVIISGEFVKQKPEMANKKPRIIIAYQQMPNADIESILEKLKQEFSEIKIDLYWGTRNDLAKIASKP